LASEWDNVGLAPLPPPPTIHHQLLSEFVSAAGSCQCRQVARAALCLPTRGQVCGEKRPPQLVARKPNPLLLSRKSGAGARMEMELEIGMEMKLELDAEELKLERPPVQSRF